MSDYVIEIVIPKDEYTSWDDYVEGNEKSALKKLEKEIHDIIKDKLGVFDFEINSKIE